MYYGPDGPKIYVPFKRRKALFSHQHKAINHMAAEKTHRELRKSYFWPSMRKDCRTWYLECPRCELLKAKRNLAHATFHCVAGAPPRKRWGMDFHGVGTKDIKGNVLGAIDLDSLWVELHLMEMRSADNVRDFVRDRILFRHGSPQSIYSDHARELVGRVMMRLAATFDYSVTSTGGYCLSGNSTMELFWQFFNVCLRLLSDAEYVDGKSDIQHTAWAWNTTHSSSTSVRPFEVMHGMTPVTLTDLLVLNASSTKVMNDDKNAQRLAPTHKLLVKTAIKCASDPPIF